MRRPGFKVHHNTQDTCMPVLLCQLYHAVATVQCFASWLSMCKVEMALINISSSN